MTCSSEPKANPHLIFIIFLLWLDMPKHCSSTRVHRLCCAIEGRLNHFLSRWLRPGWQSVIHWFSRWPITTDVFFRVFIITFADNTPPPRPSLTIHAYLSEDPVNCTLTSYLGDTTSHLQVNTVKPQFKEHTCDVHVYIYCVEVLTSKTSFSAGMIWLKIPEITQI